MIFRNPQNNYEICTDPFFPTLMLGPIYFIKHGIWTHAIISIILASITVGISWVIYPFFAGMIVRDHYLKKGWIERPDV